MFHYKQDALDDLLGDESLKNRVQAISRQIQEENRVERIVDHVAEHLRQLTIFEIVLLAMYQWDS